jgi:hypothetical protein
MAYDTAGHGLVGAGGALGLRPHGSRYALTAWALPLRHALRAGGLGFAMAACTTHLQLGLCPRSLRYVLMAWALP